jgi:hypothetical protein
MLKEKLKRLAVRAHILGGWLMLPLCLFCIFGAFVAADERELVYELILAALAAWSGFEFSCFIRRLRNPK